jgi:hypothetical protein
MLRVTQPKGKGAKVSMREAISEISSRTDAKLDNQLVSKVVKTAGGEFVIIGEYDYNPANDALLSVDITDAEMKAYLTASPPGEGGTDPDYDTVVTFLQNNGVTEGILQDVVQDFCDKPKYKQSILVAEGRDPVNGADARIAYNFEQDASKIQLKEKDGRIDFKELNLVHNVVEGQVLAKKVPAEDGTAGTTVTGKLLPAKDGKDTKIEVGKNVRLSDDKSTAISEINGQVIMSGGKINVEPIYVVQGDVNLKTGNILFLGTVVVKGNVTDGFSVKAAGNIEVMGGVGKCELDAEGDIIVHQGVTGKSEGIVKAGRTIWSKFIENSHVESGAMVVVSDGIINSNVLADKKIICKGKRASIVGGHLRSSEEINAKTLGSVAGSETILEVGYDPKSKEKLSALSAQKEEIDKNLDEVNLNIATLENQKKIRKKLTEEKEKYFQELGKKRAEIQTELSKINEEMQTIQNYLAELRHVGKISASGVVYPGVKVNIKDASLEVRNEFKAVTFIAEGDTVKVSKYEDVEDDISINRKE